MPEARYMPGNGITLCGKCHGKMHEGFNGRADMSLPMDAEGGEKIEILAELYDVLAREELKFKAGHNPYFYYISESILVKFRIFQGYEWFDSFGASTPLGEAAAIWRAPPLGPLAAIMEANFGIRRGEVRDMILARKAVPEGSLGISIFNPGAGKSKI